MGRDHLSLDMDFFFNHQWLIVAFVFFGIIFYISRGRRQDRKLIDKRFGSGKALAMSFGVNYFGRSTEPGPPRRSSGFLLLLPDRLFYRSRLAKLELEIPKADISGVYHDRNHKGADLSQSVVKMVPKRSRKFSRSWGSLKMALRSIPQTIYDVRHQAHLCGLCVACHQFDRSAHKFQYGKDDPITSPAIIGACLRIARLIYIKINCGMALVKTASKERPITKARRMLCYLAVRKLMLSCTEVARQLNISPTAVSRAATIGRKLPDRRKIQKQLLDIEIKYLKNEDYR